MRSTPCHYHEWIWLIQQGTDLIVGECFIDGSGEPIQSKSEAKATLEKHKVEDYSLLEKWRYPWIIKHAHRYSDPVKYEKKRGAVIWVRKPKILALENRILNIE